MRGAAAPPVAIAVVVVLVSGQALAAQQLTGDWIGEWRRAGDAMEVVLHVERDGAGAYHATFDAERLRVSGIPFNQVRVDGCCDVTMVLRGDRTTMTFGGRVTDDVLEGTLTDEDGSGTFHFQREPPSAPLFDEHDVTFTSGDVTLAGTVLMPRSGAGLTGVVFAHGSGPEGRWASRFLAERLARAGIASLIFDKRGVGESTGDWQRATIDDLADDVAAAFLRLMGEPNVADDRVGVFGHSQGGTLMPMFAAGAYAPAFVIASAASGIPTDSTELYSILQFALPSATSAQDSAEARAYVGRLVEVAYSGLPAQALDAAVSRAEHEAWFVPPPPPENGYWTFSPMFAEYDALEWWRSGRVPVLLLYGEEDDRVPARESAARIAATLLRAGNGNVTVRVFEDADHTFRLSPGPSGWPVTAPGYVETVVGWVGNRYVENDATRQYEREE